MKSPYQSPSGPPVRCFLRRRPAEGEGGVRKRRFLLIGAAVAVFYLLYALVLSDTGMFRIAALRRENVSLAGQKTELALRVNDLERQRKVETRDPLLEERAARERYHLVKKGEILYRYREPDSAR